MSGLPESGHDWAIAPACQQQFVRSAGVSAPAPVGRFSDIAVQSAFLGQVEQHLSEFGQDIAVQA